MDDAVRELRIGVVLYGGVSLAVYLFGSVTEMLSVVRATNSDPDELTPLERVYRDAASVSADGIDDRPHTRVVIDSIAGSSAGGINGILLAVALAGGHRLDQLARLWIDEADLGRLVRRGERRPGSLLDGERFAALVRQALASTLAGPGSGPLVDQLELAVTLTDLEGRPTPTLVPGAPDDQLIEPNHLTRARFWFGRRHSSGSDTSTLGTDDLDRLTEAARATAGFPVAFEPLGRRSDRRWLVDGGAVDNKPFGPVIDRLPRLLGPLPSRRILVYVEPDPDTEGARPPSEDTPDVLATAWGALEAGRAETIRDDLDRIASLNGTAAHLGRVTDRLLPLLDPGRPSTTEWELQDRDQILARHGPGFIGYEELKVRRVTDDLAQLAARLIGARSPARRRTLEHLTQHWVQLRYRANHGSDPTGPEPTTRRFLLEADLAYRLRRLRFLAGLIERLLGDVDADAVWAVAGGRPSDDEWQEPAIALRGELARHFTELRLVGRLMRAGDDEGLRAWLSTEVDPDRAAPALDALDRIAPLRPAELVPLVDELTHLDPRDPTVLAGPVAGEVLAALDTLAQRLAPVTAAVYPTLAERLEAALDADHPAARVAAVAHGDFDTLDAALLPLLGPSGAVPLTPVEVIRFSPLDGSGLIDERAAAARVAAAADADAARAAQRRRKLAGTGLGGFAGFLERSWRENDLVWGRLDASEQLIRALVDDPAQADRLVLAARHALLDEPVAGLDRPRRTTVGELLFEARTTDIDALADSAIGERRPDARRESAVVATSGAALIALGSRRRGPVRYAGWTIGALLRLVAPWIRLKRFIR